MNRIWLTGSSGSGKTTLAGRISKILGIPLYHRDLISWKSNWILRPEEEQLILLKEMTSRDQWIFDGNKFGVSLEDGRYETCEVLIHLTENRFKCFYRAVRRYLVNKHEQRHDLPKGCPETFDWTLAKYILYDYPSRKKSRQRFFNELKKNRPDVLVLTSKKEVDEWVKKLERSVRL